MNICARAALPLANALVYNYSEEQVSFVPEPSEQQIEVKSKYDRMIEAVLNPASRSFSQEDLTVLRSVLDGNIDVNFQKSEMIVANLNKIKRSML